MKKILLFFILIPSTLFANEAHNKIHDILGPINYTPPPNYKFIIASVSLAVIATVILIFLWKRWRKRAVVTLSEKEQALHDIRAIKIDATHCSSGLQLIVAHHNRYLLRHYLQRYDMQSYRSTVSQLKEIIPPQQWENLDALSREQELVLFAGQDIDLQSCEALRQKILCALEDIK